jgi:hypothetical protein
VSCSHTSTTTTLPHASNPPPLQGEPGETLPQLVAQTGAGLLVTDYSPLRLGRTWKQQVNGQQQQQQRGCACA